MRADYKIDEREIENLHSPQENHLLLRRTGNGKTSRKAKKVYQSSFDGGKVVFVR